MIDVKKVLQGIFMQITVTLYMCILRSQLISYMK